MPELPRNLPHLYLRGSGKAEPYTTRLRARGRPLPQRERAVHAEAVRFALAGAMAAAAGPARGARPGCSYRHSWFLSRFRTPGRIGRRSANGWRIVRNTSNSSRSGRNQRIRRRGRPFLCRMPPRITSSRKVEQYRDENTRNGKPKNEALIARIQSVALAAVRSVYTDDAGAVSSGGRANLVGDLASPGPCEQHLMPPFSASKSRRSRKSLSSRTVKCV